MGEYHPAIVHSNGYIESHPPGALVDDQHKSTLAQSFAAERNSLGGPARSLPAGQPQQQLEPAFTFRPEADRAPGLSGPAGLGIMAARQEPAHDMRRLEALVAVATGEQQAASGLQ
jgi:C2H2 transcription facotor